MKIENNLMVSVTYELHEGDKDGKIIETVADTRPLSFIFGTGKLLPAFESNLSTLSKGDSFSFLLGAADAYGERMEDMVVDVPVSVFERDGKIDGSICQVGNEVPMMDGAGNPLNGIITEISDTHVKMDFNHPMAGVGLYFSGKVIDVRVPSAEELAGPSHSCSGCGSDSGASCCSTDDAASCCSDGNSGCSGHC